MTILFYYFFILNAIGFLLTAYDKYLAKAKKQRISEKNLLGCVLVGGTIGSGLAMLIFKHKTSKVSYLCQYWGILFFQVLIAFLWFNFDYFKL